MQTRDFARAFSVVGACAATVLAIVVLAGPLAHAAKDKDDDGDESKIRQGFESAPVPLNLAHKNRALVGLGSYIVNNQGECNGCHSAGPQTQFVVGFNPYLGQPERTNPDTYLGGGRDFGPFPTPNSPVHIVSRNLTPDANGVPIGGDTFEEFRHTIRTGQDPDLLHPVLPFGFKGELLQIMPWPSYANMTDRDLRAIYEYLSAIPCVVGPDHPCD